MKETKEKLEQIKKIRNQIEQIKQNEIGKLTGKPSVDKPWLKFYSEEAKNKPLPEMTIYEYMYEENKNHLDDIALNYFGKKTTYDELFKQIEQAAKAMKQIGIKKGDVVTICMPNTPEVPVMFYALNRIGAVVNFVHPLSKQKDFEHYLEEAKSDILITYTGRLDDIEHIDSKKLGRVITVSPYDSLPFGMRLATKAIGFIQSMTGKKKPLTEKQKAYLKWQDFIKMGKHYQGELDVPYEKDRVAVMVHTGGTTGEPKGVLLTNDNYNTEVEQIRKAAKFKRKEIMLGITPPFISYVSCNALHMPLSLGLELVLLPEFIPSKFHEYLKKYKPQQVQGNPGYCEALMRNEKVTDEMIQPLTYLVSGGDKMYPKTEQMINDFLKAHGSEMKVTKGLGATECTSCVTFTFEEANCIDSVGIPLVNTTVKIVKPGTEEEVGYNEVGELCVSSPIVMKEYYNNEEETKRALRVHKDGKLYCHMGDLVSMDYDGRLFHMDRTRRIYLTQDEGNVPAKIFPNKIESVVLKHPAVHACIAVGVPHPDRIHLAKAYIELEQGYTFTEELQRELNDLCMNELPEYMLPYEFEQTTAFPRTAIGKIDYRALEEANKDNFYQKSEKSTQKVYKKEQ